MQKHSNHKGTEKKTRFLGRKSLHRVNTNADIKNTIKQCATCLELLADTIKRAGNTI